VSPIRVVVADDHPVFRAGLLAVFAASDDIVAVAEVGTGPAAVEAAVEHAPDVILLDLQMPEFDGIEATRQIITTTAGVAVLILSMSDSDAALYAAIRAGASGYLVKGAGPAEVVAAVRSAAAGLATFDPAVADRVRAALSDPTARSGPLATLSKREREVLELVARGLDNAAIAQRLCLSPSTARNYVSSCMTKLGAATRAEAVARARDAGLGSEHQQRFNVIDRSPER
jgi:DNA-binding NarL/FixJ family response regulator